MQVTITRTAAAAILVCAPLIAQYRINTQYTVNTTFNRPHGIALDPSGNLFVADTFGSYIREVATNGAYGRYIITWAGNGIPGFADSGYMVPSQVSLPYGMSVVDGWGVVYFADSGNNRIRRFSIYQGVITTVAGTGASGFSGDGGSALNASLNFPAGVVGDTSNNVYIADTMNNRIRKVSNGYITTVAGNGTAGFSGDGGLAISAQLNQPYAIAEDSAGNLYIADSLNHRVRKIVKGVISTVAGNGVQDFSGDGGPAVSASLNTPQGVAVDSSGNIVIADTNNNRIRMVTNGVITTIAGNGTAGYSGDGLLATSAALNHPTGAAVDDLGNIFVADSNNNVIRTLESVSIPLQPDRLYFGVTPDGSIHTDDQLVGVTAASSAAPISVAPSDDSSFLALSWIGGAGSPTFHAAFTVGIVPSKLPPGGSASGSVRVANFLVSQTLNVTVTPVPNSAPFGSFDLPVNGSNNVTGAIAVSGWALDSIQVTKVQIYREPLSGEGSSLLYIGDAIFVDGARPDVAAGYPTYPLSTRAGWGYQLLTNFLPNKGNGTFKLHAIAVNKTNVTTDLGVRTITCNNSNATKPFGTIDTPAQGGNINVSSYYFQNFGWVLTPPPQTIPQNGSTITVYIDGKPVGRPEYNHFRSDIAALFPGYNNSNGAAGVFNLYVPSIEYGIHSIYWGVVDDAGHMEGIGSRFFTAGFFSILAAAPRASVTAVRSVHGAHTDAPPRFRRGFGQEASLEPLRHNRPIEIGPMDRLELHVPEGSTIRDLPPGSTFDSDAGIFYWGTAPGLLGRYELVFYKSAGEVLRIPVIVGSVPTLDQ